MGGTMNHLDHWIFRSKTLRSAVLTLVLLTPLVSVQATVPNIQGREFSGQVAETEMGVVTIFNMRLRFDQQIGDQVDGSGSTDDGGTFTFSGQVAGGSILVMGTFSSEGDTGTFNAQINGSVLSLQYQEDLLAYNRDGCEL